LFIVGVLLGDAKPFLLSSKIDVGCRELGLEVVPLSSFVSKNEQKPALFLGFAGCNASEIRRGVSVLEAILSR
jgi:DNA-binding transcriptional MocR family regulator